VTARTRARARKNGAKSKNGNTPHPGSKEKKREGKETIFGTAFGAFV
jgi:hypothetical protein